MVGGNLRPFKAGMTNRLYTFLFERVSWAHLQPKIELDSEPIHRIGTDGNE
jgi:hypothetical protein